ncbi:hypothetical protein DPEC_G00296110 [Dallia pectoralis]|uniref:Uncharacterized protein n=1 Tax=Dallia pectoralis TaxID=75939 RepID=A0ACC2FJ06_DALPE|nr:hypothetical protein DPEC_G00296110 [Dallia pectoralis]
MAAATTPTMAAATLPTMAATTMAATTMAATTMAAATMAATEPLKMACLKVFSAFVKTTSCSVWCGYICTDSGEDNRKHINAVHRMNQQAASLKDSCCRRISQRETQPP